MAQEAPRLREALHGRFEPHHTLIIGAILSHLEFLDEHINQLSEAIETELGPTGQAAITLPATITGVAARTAEAMIAEIGTDMSVFPSAGHLASWAGSCPGNDQSAGKRRSGHRRNASKFLGIALQEAALAATRTKNSYLQAQYQRLKPRLGHRRALGAVQHSMLVAYWHMFTNGETYRELGGDYYSTPRPGTPHQTPRRPLAIPRPRRRPHPSDCLTQTAFPISVGARSDFHRPRECCIAGPDRQSRLCCSVWILAFNSAAPHLTQPAVESSGGCSSLGARTRVKTPKRFSTATMPAGERNESSTAARSTRSTECPLGSFAVRLGGGMKAHEAVETFTKVAEGKVAEGQEKVAEGQNAATQAEGIPVRAAVVVAVLAAFLAIATFLSNESVKAVITGETKAADTSARLETNNVKDLLASSDSTLLRVVGTGNPKEAVAVAKAEALETRIKTQLVPIEKALRAKIATDIEQRNRADSQHIVYELSETALQIGIVLAGISILARRRWLLAGGGLVGLAGIALLLAGLIY